MTHGYFWANHKPHTSTQIGAFQMLKCTIAPVLGYADFSLPFEVHIDATGIGLGAVLYQKEEGKKRVIACASRTLSQSEARYPAHKLEFLALK